MKRVAGILAGLFLVFAIVGTASALPTTWTDVIDFNPDITVPPSLDYYHNIADDGFSSAWMGGNDTITGFELLIDMYDDGEGTSGYLSCGWFRIPYSIPDGPEVALISVALVDWTWASPDGTVTVDDSFAGTLDIYHDGTLNVKISSSVLGGFGDFVVAGSTLNVYGDNGDTAPVPEPATMLLLGTGLLGLAGTTRKKFLKKK